MERATGKLMQFQLVFPTVCGNCLRRTRDAYIYEERQRHFRRARWWWWRCSSSLFSFTLFPRVFKQIGLAAVRSSRRPTLAFATLCMKLKFSSNAQNYTCEHTMLGNKWVCCNFPMNSNKYKFFAFSDHFANCLSIWLAKLRRCARGISIENPLYILSFCTI